MLIYVFVLEGMSELFTVIRTYEQKLLNSDSTFDSVQSAQRAKASLNGADIYSGCCTLKIEYAKVRAPYKHQKSAFQPFRI